MSQSAPLPVPTSCPRARESRRGGVLLKLAITLVVVAGGAIGGFYWMTAGPTEQMAAADTALQPVGHKSFDVMLTANGDLQAGEETVLRNPLEKPSAIVEIVPEGVMVKKGNILVRLSTDDIQRDLDNQLLDLETARSEMIRAENNLAIQESDNFSTLRSAKIKLDLANRELDKWEKGTDKETITQLDLDIDAARREVERLTEKVERARKLFNEDFLSSDELKRDELELIRQQSNREKAELRKTIYMEYDRDMQITRLKSTIDEATAELDRVERRNASELASKKADLTNRQRQLALRQDRVNKLQQQIAAATIIAPTDGLVVYATSIRQDRWGGNEGPLKVGTQISPNDEIIILPDNSRMVASIKVHESLVGRVKPGLPARVKIDAVRDRIFNGHVESVGVVAEQGGWRDPNLREYAVRIALDLGEENPGLKPSMRCEGQIVLSTVENVLAAPIQAVFYEGRQSYVHVPVAGGRFAKREVRVGTRSTTYAEITAGLNDGEVVLVRKPGTHELASDAIDSSRMPPSVAEGSRGDQPKVLPTRTAEKPAEAPQAAAASEPAL